MNTMEAVRLSERAIDLLKSNFADKAHSISISVLDVNSRRPDLVLNINFDQHQYIFSVQIKKRLVSRADLLFINDNIPQKGFLLIIAEYISPAVAEVLRMRNISYIDIRGNIFLKSNQLFIFINKADKKAVKIQFGSAFQKSGITLLLYILQKPEILTLSYKQISDIAEISTGSISKILNDLKRRGFYYERNNKRIIRNQKELISQWVTAYGIKLRPEYVIGKYRAQSELKSLKLADNALWSGEEAAELLNLNLKRQTATIYTATNPISVIKKFHLIPDEDGNIELLRIFWNTNELLSGINNTAPTLIIYADLLLSSSSRNMEIAEELYERDL